MARAIRVREGKRDDGREGAEGDGVREGGPQGPLEVEVVGPARPTPSTRWTAAAASPQASENTTQRTSATATARCTRPTLISPRAMGLSGRPTLRSRAASIRSLDQPMLS